MGKKLNKYQSVIVPNLEKIRTERINGATIQDIVDWLGIHRDTFYKYMRTYDDLRDVMNDAEVQMHAKIESVATHALLDKLQPQTVVTEEIIDENGIVIRTKRKTILPDTQAVIFALKSRNPEVWDSLGVARLKQDENQQNMNEEILSELQKYNTNNYKDE